MNAFTLQGKRINKLVRDLAWGKILNRMAFVPHQFSGHDKLKDQRSKIEKPFHW